MIIAFATANLYYMEFERALEIIRKAGFEYIELDGYWKGDNWETAQHLKEITPAGILQMVKSYDLQIASYHDMGGIIDTKTPTIISEWSKEFLNQIDIPCLTVHTPHKKTDDVKWWQKYRETAIQELQAWNKKIMVTIENMQPFEGFQVPLLNPHEMFEFAEENDFGITLDTMHCGVTGIDITCAADCLASRIQTIHLSDYAANKYHAPLGEGELDFVSFYQKLNMDKLYATTIECYIPEGENADDIAAKCRETLMYFEKILSCVNMGKDERDNGRD